jgi:hypothetical protein
VNKDPPFFDDSAGSGDADRTGQEDSADACEGPTEEEDSCDPNDMPTNSRHTPAEASDPPGDDVISPDRDDLRAGDDDAPAEEGDSLKACSYASEEEESPDSDAHPDPCDRLTSLRRSLEQSSFCDSSQLYSILFCVYRDCEVVLAKNRPWIPFSIHSEAMRHPHIRLDGGVLSHRKFPDGFDVRGMSPGDQDDLFDFVQFRCDVARRALPPVVTTACGVLKDPLLRSHEALAALRRQIKELRKANAERKVRSRQTANQLVKISKDDINVEPPDVTVQQQRLHKCLARLHGLREANEAAVAANSILQAKLAHHAARPLEQEVSQRIIELQKRIGDVKVGNGLSEEEREATMAQRRVAVGRMTAAIQRLIEENDRISFSLSDIENRLRIMAQGQREAVVVERRPTPPTVKPRRPSKIPVFRHDKTPDLQV